MTEYARPRLIGFNHVALEVGDIEEALAFYGRLFKFELRGKSDTMAFIDLGDQFIALQKGRSQPPDALAGEAPALSFFRGTARAACPETREAASRRTVARAAE